MGRIKTGMAKLCAPYLLEVSLPRDWDISKLDNGGGIRVLGRRGCSVPVGSRMTARMKM